MSCYIWPYCVQYNTCSIIGHCHSTVKIARVSDRYWYFLWDGTTKGSLCALFHWPMMIILFLLCFILKCHVSLFVSRISNQWFLGILCQIILRQSKNDINFDFRFLSTATLEVSLILLPKIRKHQTAEQYQGSYNSSDLDPKSDVNRPVSGKIW